MPKIIETQVFQFSELSDKAKQKALEWYSQFPFTDSGDWDHVECDAIEIASLFGLEIDKIYFSVFSNQGDGACFEGSYKYKKGGLAAVKQHAPTDTELHSIVKRLQEVQSKQFYNLEASCKQSGHYNHSGCMSVEVSHAESNYKDIGDAEDDIRDLLREYADWIYSNLSKEYDYQTSEEAMTEAIEANQYEFLEDGSRA